MPKVFATAPGAAITVGNCGIAGYENGIEVPQAVADQIEDEIAGMPRDVEGKRVQTHEKRTDLRLERDAPPAPARRAPQAEQKKDKE